MGAGKTLIIILIVALLVGGYYYMNKNAGPAPMPPIDGEGIKADQKKIVADPVSNDLAITPPVTNATTPPPLPSKILMGKTLKSRGKNKFDLYTLQNVDQDVKQSDGTYKRQQVTSYIKEKGLIHKRKFQDGEPVGMVVQVTDSGFFMRLPDLKYVWANKDLLIQ